MREEPVATMDYHGGAVTRQRPKSAQYRKCEAAIKCLGSLSGLWFHVWGRPHLPGRPFDTTVQLIQHDTRISHPYLSSSYLVLLAYCVMPTIV
ncbi:hypothetical protein J6590_005840, partial [Homalodisca vitripennis]